MVSVIQLQYLHQINNGERRRDAPRDNFSQTTNSSSVAQTTASVSSAPSTPSSFSTSSSKSFSSPSPSSNTSQQSSYSNSDQAIPPHKDTKIIIVLGVIGGILGLLLLGFIAFRLVVRRYQQHHRTQNDYVLYNSFWGKKWDWRTHSPVDQVRVTTLFPDDQEKVMYDSGIPSYTWFGLHFFPPSDEVRTVEGKKEKRKSRMLYKIKRCKPSKDFDIDACTPLSSQKSQA